MKYKVNSVLAISVGIAMTCMIACAPTTHVTETTTTRQYDTTTPPILPAPIADANTTTTTQYNNGTVQRTYTQPGSLRVSILVRRYEHDHGNDRSKRRNSAEADDNHVCVAVLASA